MAGVSGYNKPKRTPNHPTKSHIVVAKEGNKIKVTNKELEKIEFRVGILNFESEFLTLV